MKKLLNLFCMGALVCLFAACDDESARTRGEEKQEETQGTDVAFTEYSLKGTSCVWTNLDYDGKGKLLVINSDEELKNHISGTDYPAVDFSKKTLLLASGRTGYSIHEIVNRLQSLSVGKYKWSIEITLGDATVVIKWGDAILIDKLSKESEVELDVNVIRN